MKLKEIKLHQSMMPRGFGGCIMGWIMLIVHDSINKLALPMLDLRPEDNMLDVGCEPGCFLKKHASHIKTVAGMDVSEVMIKMAIRRNRYRIEAGTAEFVQGEASELP
jgi:ubiquinone/menaquinone biosynthesis C-methylase UbiE